MGGRKRWCGMNTGKSKWEDARPLGDNIAEDQFKALHWWVIENVEVELNKTSLVDRGFDIAYSVPAKIKFFIRSSDTAAHPKQQVNFVISAGGSHRNYRLSNLISYKFWLSYLKPVLRTVWDMYEEREYKHVG